jgi:hypothetical protein
LLLASSVFKRGRLLLLESVAGIPASVPLLASLLWFVSFLFLLQHYLYAFLSSLLLLASLLLLSLRLLLLFFRTQNQTLFIFQTTLII